MNTAGIYEIRNTTTGRAYIGSTRSFPRRFSEHKSRLRRGVHTNARLQASWNKHGESVFTFAAIASVIDFAQLEALEQTILDDRRAVELGYNLAPTAGNTAGWRAGPETRARMSEAAKRRTNAVQIIAMAEATRGKARPQYVIDAMQRGRREAPLNAASRKRMSDSATARSRYSSEDRAAMSAMRDAGATWRAIGAVFGVQHQAVMVYVKAWRAANV